MTLDALIRFHRERSPGRTVLPACRRENACSSPLARGCLPMA